MSYYQHPQALVESTTIGEGTRIWAYAHILPGAQIGKNCNICDHTYIENDVTIGDNVTVKSGVQLWDGTRLEDDVFVGPNATFTNDHFPRSKKYPEKFLITTVRRGASIGANATLLPGITIGRCAMVGAGAVVTRDVPPNAIVTGNPARISGYTTSAQPLVPVLVAPEISDAPVQPNVGGVRVYRMPVVRDLRGTLSFGEYDAYLPFIPRRYFLVYDVPSKDVRGEHAHHTLEQFLICVKGSMAVVVDDGTQRAEIRMDGPQVGVYVPPMIWATEYKYSADAVLLVLASDIYRSEDYIRDYDDYLALVGKSS